MNDPSLHPAPRRVRLLLFFGSLFLFLAFFKGEGGYHDLVYYMDDAEGLWLRGDMSRPGESDYIDMPDGSMKEVPVYSQYSLGLAFVSGPFVLLGHVLEKLTNGALGARSFAVLIIPLMSALSALLIYEIALLLGSSSRAALWGAILFGAGTPQLTFARLFYTEVAVICFALLAIWAFLRSVSADSPSRAPLWALLSGAGLAGAGACHYAEAAIVVALCAAMALSYVLTRFSYARRALCIAAMMLIPTIAVSAIGYVNVLRHGKITETGYSTDVAALGVNNLVFNCRYLFYSIESRLKLGLFFRSPWIPFAIACFALWRGRPGSWPLRYALLLGVALQAIFWMCYEMLGFSPLRYFQPLTGVAAVTLFALADAIQSRAPRWGLPVVGGLLIAFNSVLFVLGDDHNRPILFAPDTGKLIIYTWYMQPFPPGIEDGYGTPPGFVQWAVLCACLGFAVWCFWAAWRRTYCRTQLSIRR